jgi:hypothetical protein
MDLGENGGGGRVGLENAETVVLVEEEVEVAGGVGLDGVELTLIGGAAEAGSCEAGGLGSSVDGSTERDSDEGGDEKAD